MRVSINSGPARDLGAGLERRLRVRKAVEVVEGVVLTPDEAVAQAMRGMKLLYGFTLGFAAVLVVAMLVGVASWEPGDLVILAPVALILGAGVGWFVRFMYRRNLVKVRARAETMASLAEPGETVRVDAEGLTVGMVRYPWPQLTVEEVGVAEASADETTYVFVDRLMLSSAGKTIDLDLLALKNGRDIVSQAWRRIRAQAQ